MLELKPTVPPHETLVYTPPATDPTAPKFNLSFRAEPWSNGPPGETNYIDHVAYMGWNYLLGSREEPTQAAFGLAWESKFFQNVFGQEFHLQGVGTDGTQRRWLGVFLPVAGASGSVVTISVDSVNFRTGDVQDRIAMSLAGSTPRVFMNGGVIFQFNVNNLPTLQQMNAAGTGTIPLPFVDDFDRITVGGGMFVNAPVADNQYNAAVSVNVATLAANKAVLYGQNALVTTGNVLAFNFYNMNATGKVVGAVGNNSAGGDAILEARTEATGGDPILSVQVNGETGYSIGIDNSDANKFKISAGVQRLGVGAEDRLVIDANRAEWSLPLKLRSYTVAALPSAANAGAGGSAYVANASGGPTLACSDGTNWRVVAALGAVVS